MRNLVAALLSAGLLFASCSLPAPPPAPPPDADGTWTLVGQSEEDGTERAPPADFVTTFTVDGKAGTIVRRTAWVNVSPPMPDMVLAWTFTVDREGHWLVHDAQQGGSIEVAVVCTPGSLVLTRVRYEGPGEVVPPPPATKEGNPPLTGEARRPPPKALRFSR